MNYFEIPGKPQGKARARTFYNPKLGRMQSITPENTVLYENLVKQAYREQVKQTFFDGESIKLFITACFEVPKSTSKKNREAMLNLKIRPNKKPDADNIAKVICDALNGVAYHDDTQITFLIVSKIYSEGEPKVKCYIGIDE